MTDEFNAPADWLLTCGVDTVAALAGPQRVPSTTVSNTKQNLTQVTALSRGADARLAIRYWLPGSGKSFVAQPAIDAVGAIGVRSDVERKHLFGPGALESSRARVPEGIDDRTTTRYTYSHLLEIAKVVLPAGRSMSMPHSRADRSARSSLRWPLRWPSQCQFPIVTTSSWCCNSGSSSVKPAALALRKPIWRDSNT